MRRPWHLLSPSFHHLCILLGAQEMQEQLPGGEYQWTSQLHLDPETATSISSLLLECKEVPPIKQGPNMPLAATLPQICFLPECPPIITRVILVSLISPCGNPKPSINPVLWITLHTDAEAPDFGHRAKSWLIGKDLDAAKDWRQKEKRGRG